ncbi:MAG: PRC-barrel domain-containing protein [Deltaproteobacteria bacterium]
MKKTSEIIGLPVVDLSTGNQLGTVYDLIINEEKGGVDYFIVDDGFILLGAKVIDERDVKGLGEYAVTVARRESVKDINRVDLAVNLYKKRIKVKNTRVITQSGKLIGDTGDIYISQKDYLITAVEFINSDKKSRTKVVSRKDIIAFGENLVVLADGITEMSDADLCKVSDDIEDKKSKLSNQYKSDNQEFTYKEPAESKNVDITRAPAKQAEPKNSAKKEQVDKKPAVQVEKEKEVQTASLKSKNVKEEEIQETVPDFEVDLSFEEGISAKNVYYRPGVKQYEIHKKQAAENLKKEQPKSSELFEIKQREYLLGRKVTKEILDKMGNSILTSGELITEAAMNKAKEAGKFIELVMNNRP